MEQQPVLGDLRMVSDEYDDAPAPGERRALAAVTSAGRVRVGWSAEKPRLMQPILGEERDYDYD